MNAKEAKELSQLGERKQQAKRMREAEKESRLRKKQLAYAMDQIPKYMKEIEEDIADAADKGVRKTIWGVHYSMDYEVSDKILANLRKYGYKASVDHRSGTSDMGDFNAPCVVDWSSTDFIIEW